MPYRLFIIEDHPVIRSAYVRLLQRQTDFEVCGEAENGDKALTLIPSAHPDLVLVDISLPGMNGIELLNRLRADYPELPTLVISGHEESLYAKLALQAGAKGYVVKAGLSEVMIPAIRHVLNGEFYMSDELRHTLLPDQN
ncbi:MAG: response regulator transcription factor [Chloroflexi bacterium]|nr:response regulator transcription factor [Chloroflexota bacterium]